MQSFISVVKLFTLYLSGCHLRGNCLQAVSMSFCVTVFSFSSSTYVIKKTIKVVMINVNK